MTNGVSSFELHLAMACMEIVSSDKAGKIKDSASFTVVDDDFIKQRFKTLNLVHLCSN
jgi:hypothetical protein